jgi:structural maintenance of chromosomes protein 5
MVVGANGTGKSTILNAICLGLGGEPKLLGRADDLRAFIMHSKDTAMIEIELAPHMDADGEPQEPHIIQRHIDRHKGSEKGRGRGASTFYINGEKSNIQAVRDIVCNTYNIQIDNLCTFLPQDKVGNFSGFSDQERLLETEKTLPTNQFFYKRHLELIEKEESINSDISNVDSIKDLLKRRTHEFDRLEVSKAREEERKKAEEQLDLLQKKKLWLTFDAAREKCVELKDQKTKILDELKIYRDAISPLEEKQQRLETKHKELQAKSRELDGLCQSAQKEMEKQQLKVEKHDDEMESSMTQYVQISSKRERLEVQYNEAKEKLQSLEANLANMPPSEQLEQNYNKAKDMIQSIKREYENAKREDRKQKEMFQELEDNAGRVQQKLVKMNDDGARRRENVFRNVSHLQDICSWIEKNRNRFRRPVWGPIALDITTKSQLAASYLEFHTPNNILKSFVVETREDSDFLYSSIREKKGIPINVISVEGDQINTSRLYSEQKMQLLKNRYGVEGYLDETFTAPDPVMIALQKYASVHKVLVGGEKAQQSMDRDGLRNVLSAPDSALGQQRMQSSCIFTVSDRTPYRYTQSVSQYSGKVGTRVDQVGPAKLLAPGVPEEQKQQVEMELSRIHDEIAQIRPDAIEAETNVRELEMQLQSCQLKGQSLKQSLTGIQTFQNKIVRQRQRVQDAESELQANNEAKEKSDLSKSIMNRLVHSVAAIKAHGEQHKLLLQYTAKNAGITVNLTNVRTADRLAQYVFSSTCRISYQK